LVSREDVACYRLYAADCVEIATRLSDPERKFFFLRMAQAWGNLADRLGKAEQEGAQDGEQAGEQHGLAGVNPETTAAKS
jgi:hypothetical protein